MAVTKIAEISPSSTNLVTFSSIPSTYDDLMLIGSAKTVRTTGSAAIYNMVEFRVNGDTGANYSYNIWGRELTAEYLQYSTANTAIIFHAASSSYGSNVGWGQFQIYIPAYKNATANTTMQIVGACTQGASDPQWGFTGAGEWDNTSAINALSFECGGNFTAGTTISLYGITSS